MEKLLKVVDQGLIAIIIAICGYATSELSKIQNSLGQLNTQIAVIIERINYHDKELQAQKIELERLQSIKQRR